MYAILVIQVIEWKVIHVTFDFSTQTTSQNDDENNNKKLLIEFWTSWYPQKANVSWKTTTGRQKIVIKCAAWTLMLSQQRKMKSWHRKKISVFDIFNVSVLTTTDKLSEVSKFLSPTWDISPRQSTVFKFNELRELHKIFKFVELLFPWS